MSTPSGFDAVTRENFDALAAQVEAEWDRMMRSGGADMLAEIDAVVDEEER